MASTENERELGASTIGDLIAKRLRDERGALSAQWNSPEGVTARSFVLDDLLDDRLARSTYDAFPIDEGMWHQRNTFRERKKTFAKLEKIAPVVGAVTDAFHLPAVVAAVSDITGIERLQPDPQLYAGGISMMGRGDFLNPHIDNSHDRDRSRYRRLNLLYYVSPGWDPKNGGNLELWDRKVQRPVQIPALFNRLIVMETHSTSWHSVNPVTIDAGRCCVSNYFFSEQSPTGDDYYHVTSFLGRPDQPLRRAYGRVDNAMRQLVAKTSGLSRGKHLGRHD